MNNNRDVIYENQSEETAVYNENEVSLYFRDFAFRLGVAICISFIFNLFIFPALISLIFQSGFITIETEVGRSLASWIVNDIVSYGLPIVLYILLLKKYYKNGALYRRSLRHNMSSGNDYSFWEPVFFFPVMVGLGMVGSLITNILNDLLGPDELKDVIGGAVPETPEAMWIMAFFVVIVAPVCEEIIFRGILLDSCLPFGSWFAVIITSMLFGLIHGNFDQFAYCLAVGAVLSVLTIRSKSIIPAIILHSLNNLMSTMALYSENLKLGGEIMVVFNYLIDLLNIIFIHILNFIPHLGILFLVIIIVTKKYKLLDNRIKLKPKKIAMLTFTTPTILVAILFYAFDFYTNSW